MNRIRLLLLKFRSNQNIRRNTQAICLTSCYLLVILSKCVASMSESRESVLIALNFTALHRGYLLETYPKLSRQRIIGHSDIAPERKTDLGALFDWSRLTD